MKISQKQLKKSNEVLQTLIRKSWESATFKEQLISNPAATIEEVKGKPVSSKFGKIVVEDQTDSNIIYLNIPRKLESIDDFELTEEQLELVSGGDISTTDLVLVVVILLLL